MIFVNDLNGIEEQEKLEDDKHVIILLFVKPSDRLSDEYIKKFNYWNSRSSKYCNIYLVGYGSDFSEKYNDIQIVDGVEGKKFQYSDTCFVNVCYDLSKKLKNWHYSGEPEMIVLQNNTSNSRRMLDFSNYVYIDIEAGLRKEYIDSISRFMECLLRACKSEVEAKDAVKKARFFRIIPRTIIETTLLECEKVPNTIKKIIGDVAFYKSSHSKIA